MHKSLTKGFTLIELLVVIAIIGILASIVLVSLSSARNKGKDAAVEGQLADMRAQAEVYANNNGANGYTGVCTAATGINSQLTGAVNQGTVTGVTLNVTASTGGTWNTVTCHDSNGAWAAETPLTTSASGAPKMWCVDSNGASKSETTNIAANVYACS